MSRAKVQAAEDALAQLSRRELAGLLDRLPQVREWLSGGAPEEVGAGAVLASKEAAAVLGVERQRLWRWEKTGRIARVTTTSGSPLYMRVDVQAIADGERP